MIMKRILLILILITGWQLSQAQDKYIKIADTRMATVKDTIQLKQYLVTDWWGIDPVQLKDGTYVISEHAMKEMDRLFPKLQAAVRLKEMLKNETYQTVTKDEFREPEEITTEGDKKK